MKKSVLALVLGLILALSTNVFAYRWIESGSDWFVLNEETGEYLKGMLLDVGDNVYYLDPEGKLVTGWWRNSKTNKYYFFDNKLDRNYGGMVFGLHMVDGYYYYFGDDGSLQTSGQEGRYRKVYQEYYADKDGFLYYDNELMRDTSIAKSEYYTDKAYYENINYNNYYLANHGHAITARELNSVSKSEINISQASAENTKSAASTTSGGTNYSIDAYGVVHTYGDTFETKEAEKFGPMNIR